MPVYEFVCPSGHSFSELIRFAPTATGSDEGGSVTSWPCPTCGGEGRRAMSRFAALGQGRARAAAGPSRPSWPRSWEATNGGDPDTIRHWRQAIETRMRHEERDPSLGVQPSAPVHSHEHGHVVAAHSHPHSTDGQRTGGDGAPSTDD